MHKEYSERELERILTQDLSSSKIVDSVVQSAYRTILASAAQHEREATARVNQGERTSTVTAFLQRSESAANTATIPQYPTGTASRKESESMKTIRRGRKSWKRRLLPVAAVAVAAASAITVTAMSGLFTRSTEEGDGTLAYTFAVDYTLTAHEVSVAATYIPEGYHSFMGDDLTFTQDDSGRNGISIICMQADYLARWGAESLSIAQNVKEVEHTQINGMDADLITLSYDEALTRRTFDKRIYLFDETDGCVVELYGGNDLSMDELVKVAEGLVVTVYDDVIEVGTPEEIATEKEEAAAAQAAYEEAQRAELEAPISADIVYSIGDTFDWGGTALTVESAEVLESAAELNAEYIYNYAEFVNRLNEDGTAKDYTRETYEGNPDLCVLGGYVGETVVGQQFLKVTIKAEAVGGANDDFWAGAPQVGWLTELDDGSYQLAQTYDWSKSDDEYGYSYSHRAFYFDASPLTNMDSHFFFMSLADQETREYTLVFLIDDDRLENAVLNFRIASNNPSYEKYVKLDLA